MPADARPGRSGADCYDRHGQQLYVMACVLTEDPALAERVVVQAFDAHQGTAVGRRELSAAVLAGWLAEGPHVRLPRRRSVPLVRPCAVMLHRIHALPDEQRVALALCRFGDHTYRQAAAVLGLPDDVVASLLGQAMRALQAPRLSAA